MKGFNLACWPNGKALDYDSKVIKRLQVVSYHHSGRSSRIIANPYQRSLRRSHSTSTFFLPFLMRVPDDRTQRVGLSFCQIAIYKAACVNSRSYHHLSDISQTYIEAIQGA
jgi:hypothetical protein